MSFGSVLFCGTIENYFWLVLNGNQKGNHHFEGSRKDTAISSLRTSASQALGEGLLTRLLGKACGILDSFYCSSLPFGLVGYFAREPRSSFSGLGGGGGAKTDLKTGPAFCMCVCVFVFLRGGGEMGPKPKPNHLVASPCHPPAALS